MAAMVDPPVRRSGDRQARTERLVVRLTPDGMAQLDALARKEQRTRADMARILMTRGMEKK